MLFLNYEILLFLGKKPARPPPPQSKTDEMPQQPVDSGTSGEESDDEQEQDNLEVETKVDILGYWVKI